MKQSLLFLMLFLLAHHSFSQTIFYSVQDGDWDLVSTWALDAAGTTPANTTPTIDDTVYIRDSVYQTVNKNHMHRGDVFITLAGVFDVNSGNGISDPYIFAGDTFAVYGKLITSSDFHNQKEWLPASDPDGSGLLIVGESGIIRIGDDLVLNSFGVIQMDNASCGDGSSVDDMYFRGENGRICGNGRFVYNDTIKVWNNTNQAQGQFLKNAADINLQVDSQICVGFDFFGNKANCDLIDFPIELLDFSARQRGQDVEVFWITASELNNDFFTLERSFDSKSFETVEIIQGAGNSDQNLSYKTIDLRPGKGSIFYRLKQTDYDGEFTYSSIVEIRIESPISGFNIYPNPAGSQPFFIDLFSFEPSAEIQMSILDLSGREVHQQVIRVNYEGNALVNITPNHLSSGIYIIRIKSAGASMTRKLIY